MAHTARLAALVLLAAFAVPTAADAAPVMRGTTTITATRTATVAVTLPHPATIQVEQWYESADIAVTGRGRIIGLALVRDSDDPVVLSALVLSACGKPGCLPETPFPPAEMVTSNGLAKIAPTTYLLPAGRYVAHVFTDGTPVSVKLRLRGLTGSTKIGAHARRTTYLKQPTNTFPDAHVAYSAGDSAPVKGPVTLMAFGFGTASAPHVGDVSSNCYYQNRTPPGGHVVPGCPGGQQGFIFDAVFVAAEYQSFAYGVALMLEPSESWYQGVYNEGAQGPTRFTTSLFWADLA